jgi:molecular chaperone HscB
MIRCPSCARLAKPLLTCSECGAPLAADLDCFAALGLPRKLVIDPAALESAYHDLGRMIHPDRFAAQPASVRDASLRATALLTRSYRTLRDPLSRGRYWLELHGEKLADDNQQVPPELAELVFDVQEQLGDLRAAAARGDSSAGRESIAARRAEIQAALDVALQALNRNFERWDAARDSAGNKPLVAELKAALSTIAYLRTLIRDVDRELENARAV